MLLDVGIDFTVDRSSERRVITLQQITKDSVISVTEVQDQLGQADCDKPTGAIGSVIKEQTYEEGDLL